MRLRATRLTGIAHAARRANVAWTPAALGSSLALWLDAEDASTITLNGGTVAQWDDKSGNGRHATQPTAANQPAYTVAGLNGKPIITFPGDGNSGFVLASGVPIPRDMTSVSQGLGYLYSANTASERIAYFNPGSNLFWNTATGSPANLSIPGRDGTSTFIEQYTAQNNNWEVLLNGSVAASGTISASWTNNNELTQIGLKWGAATSIPSWTGIIAEIVWTNAVMSLADRQKLEGYLAWKWGGATRPWTPADLGSSLALWLDAADASTVTLNGSTVSQWNDKSGNARHASQAVAASQPAYTPAGLNGKAVLTFDGSNDLFELSSGILLDDNFTHIHSVFGRATTGINSIDIGRTALPQGYGNWWFIDNILYSLLRGTSFVSHGGSTATGTFINGLVRNNSGTQAYRNGTAFGVPQGADATANVTLNAIGRAQGGTSAVHNGPMAEVIVGRSNLSTDDRQKIEGYLAHKWGLQANLPESHPFKNAAPEVTL